MLVEDPDERSSADYINDEALKILQGMANESDDEGTATPIATPTATPTPSVLSAEAVSVVEPKDPNENGKSTDVFDLEEEREWADTPGPETRLSQVLETTEVPPQGSRVYSLLRISGGPELCTIEAQTEDPHKEAENASFITCRPLGDEGAREAVKFPSRTQSMRKRSLSEGNSPLSLPRSFTHPPLADQKRATGPPGHKRNRVSKDLRARAKARAKVRA